MGFDFDPLNTVVLKTFGESITVDIAGVGATAVTAIYDSRHYADELGEFQGSHLITSISLETDDADNIVVGVTEITARSIVYLAKDKRPDGQGMVVVELERKTAS